MAPLNNNGKIKYLTLADIHLGNRLNRTKNIIDNLTIYFKDNDKVFKELDIIFIAGDLFDNIITTTSDDIHYIHTWLTQLLQYCIINNIKLRLLEGTATHDWGQGQIFYNIINNLNLNVDFKYIDTVYIEDMNDLDISILYVPDNLTITNRELEEHIDKLMMEKHKTKVDIAIIHGYFRHQLPKQAIKEDKVFNDDYFLNIITYYIVIGHIHLWSIFNRIISPSSFDRLTHGEEGKKGGVLITIDKNKPPHMKYTRVINKNSKVFKTLKIPNTIDTLEKLIDYVDIEIIKYPIDSYILLALSNTMFKTVDINELSRRYINYKLKKKLNGKLLEDDSVNINYVLDTHLNNIDTIEITKNNIYDLLIKEMSINTPDIDNVTFNHLLNIALGEI